MSENQTSIVQCPQNVPRVSVIIPVYNASQYIAEALFSVFQQTLASYDVIVVNDGSPDTEQLEVALKPYQSKIIYIRQENRGAAAARNSGLRFATGELVAFLDADDRWLPSYLQEQITFLERHSADLVYSDALLFGETRLANRTYMEMAPSRREVTTESLLAVDVGVITSGVVCRKQPIIEVGLFDETIRRGHDLDLWVRLARQGVKFSCHRKVLLHYRIRETGLSGDTVSQLRRSLEVLTVIKKRGGLTTREEAALDRTLRRSSAELAKTIGKSRLLENDFPGALEAFINAQSLGPTWKVLVVCFCLRYVPGLFSRLYRLRIRNSSSLQNL